MWGCQRKKTDMRLRPLTAESKRTGGWLSEGEGDHATAAIGLVSDFASPIVSVLQSQSRLVPEEIFSTG